PVQEEDPAERVRIVEEEVQERGREERAAVADRRSDGDLANEVEPASEPAPCRAAELRSPVVEAARCRVGRGDLAQGERDDRAEQADNQPAPGNRHGTALVERDGVRRQAAGEDRDDREGDGKVLEPAHRAKEFLRVPETMEGPLVVQVVAAGLDRTWLGSYAHPCLPLSPSSVRLFTRLTAAGVKVRRQFRR